MIFQMFKIIWSDFVTQSADQFLYFMVIFCNFSSVAQILLISAISESIIQLLIVWKKKK